MRCSGAASHQPATGRLAVTKALDSHADRQADGLDEKTDLVLPTAGRNNNNAPAATASKRGAVSGTRGSSGHDPSLPRGNHACRHGRARCAAGACRRAAARGAQPGCRAATSAGTGRLAPITGPGVGCQQLHHERVNRLRDPGSLESAEELARGTQQSAVLRVSVLTPPRLW